MRELRGTLERRVVHAPGLVSLVIEVPLLARDVRPGQFAMLGVGNRISPYLRRAFSIADLAAEGRCEFLLKVVGSGTRCLAELSDGASIDVLGPLGNPFTIRDLNPGDRVAVVAGGVGIAPFPLLLRALAGSGVAIDVFFGGRGRFDLSYRGRVTPSPPGKLFEATDDGSFGFHGRVTDLLARELSGGQTYRRLFACGPTPMFRSLAPIVERHGIDAEFSTEAPMGCGFGACLACVLPTPGGGYLVSCREGPILAPSRVDWSRA